MCRKSGKNEEDGNTPKPPEKLQNGALKPTENSAKKTLLFYTNMCKIEK
jgi:hypothetical protein